MSARGAFIGAALLFACTSRTEHPRDAQVTGETVAAQPEVAPPSTPTPAFRPLRDGACAPDYRAVDSVCVHLAYRAGPEQLEGALQEYKRGVVPPMLGPAPAPSVSEPRKRALGPGALSVPRDEDAGSAKERRLAELDTMIAAAREQLRQRDEASKAKKVSSVQIITVADASQAAAVIPGAAPAPGTASGAQDPTQARLSELSQLTSVLTPEQMQALGAQLTSAGIDPRQFEAVLQEARAGVVEPAR